MVGTPIGNLADMAPRAVDVLRSVYGLAAEDTRYARRLLAHFGIPRPPRLISYREENRERAAEQVLNVLRDGHDAALVTDAGMPAVSDPGEFLVARCHDEGIRVSPIPGPSAVVAALACSGLPSRRWTFEGFLSRRASHRRTHLQELAREPRTMVILEAPGRVAQTLSDLCGVLGTERSCCVARELTKKFEEVRRGTLSELLEWSRDKQMRGELTIVVEGCVVEEPREKAPDDDTLSASVASLMGQGMTRRQAAKEVAARYGLDARELYQM